METHTISLRAFLEIRSTLSSPVLPIGVTASTSSDTTGNCSMTSPVSERLEVQLRDTTGTGNPGACLVWSRTRNGMSPIWWRSWKGQRAASEQAGACGSTSETHTSPDGAVCGTVVGRGFQTREDFDGRRRWVSSGRRSSYCLSQPVLPLRCNNAVGFSGMTSYGTSPT